MKSTQTPLGLIQHSIAALGIGLLAIPVGFLRFPAGYRALSMFLLTVVGFAVSWRYRSQLQAGVRAERWSEAELDAASAWVEAPRWTRISFICCIAFALLWYVSQFRTGFETLDFLPLLLYMRMIDWLRNLVRPHDPLPKSSPSGSVPLRTELLREKALRALTEAGRAPPPRPPWKFELYQYPKKRP